MPVSGKILIVDDEENIRTGLEALLAGAEHEVKTVATAEAALSALQSFAAEAAVIDIRLPGMIGTELLAQIRERWPQLAVIMLTGHGTLESAMAAVKQGAHDYLLKPAKPKTILSTVAAAVAATRSRRAETQFLQTLRAGLAQIDEPAAADFLPKKPAQEQIVVGDLTIHCRAHAVTRAGEPIDLTPSEYSLLVALASRPGEVVKYVDLVCQALSYKSEAWEAKELIKRHVFTLRQKIEPDPAQPRYIVNVRGVGYRFAHDG